ncbi:hypothetical protein [Halobacterium jilantaiense]|uniref:Uncharacterized protein n=1 Tax=Halobacterium jilantaiense TaxID=355548 RepID=A0A1I0QIB6_9EURY|nr:hypothetical protein [Halobacterium jilantaiense]SEW26742.1 hypothetical protein SAMN04487945_2633 [Halobacterium jilantaiense]
MPGGSWPLLGSTVATVLVAGVAGLAVTAAVWHPSLRSHASSPSRFAAGFGVAYAVVTVALWAGTTLLARPDPLSLDPAATLFWVALAALGAAAVAGASAYVYARFRYATSLFALFAATAFTWYTFLVEGGGSITLAIWGSVFVPVFLLAAAALFAVEWGLRTVTHPPEAGGPPA